MLLGKSPLGGASIVQLAAFAGMPLIFMALPTLVMGFVVHSVGVRQPATELWTLCDLPCRC